MRLRSIMIFIVISFIPAAACGEWSAEGYIGARGGLSVVSSNWSGEETDSSDWALKADLSAKKKTGKYRWENILRYDYGQTVAGESGAEEKADEIYAESAGLVDSGTFLFPYAKMDVRTQTTEFADPATLTESLGLEAVLMPEEKPSSLSTRAGIAFRQRYRTDAGTLKDIGAQWDTRYRFKLKEKLKFVSRSSFFSAFNAGSDFRWENNLYYKLSDILTLQAGYVARHEYDEAGPRPQLPEDIQTRLTLSVGFSYNLFTPGR